MPRVAFQAEVRSPGGGIRSIREAASRAISRASRALGKHPRDAIGALLGLAGVSAVLINALYLQSGPHPAPMFAMKPPPASRGITTSYVRVPRSRPGEMEKPEAGGRPRPEVVAEVQRGLERLGFYEGAVDGVMGPKTDAAIRDFQHAAGFTGSGEPGNELLQAISRSRVKVSPASQQGSAQSSGSGRPDTIGNLIAGSSKRLLAVQRALGDFGYGPLRPTGVFDADTRAAIEKFERERKMPITGQVTDRLARELAAVTGRPLE